jgi:putative FmdB family regulatory protein
MPFYEYECTNCKFYVESLQKISEPPLRKCPSCKKQTMKRLVSAPVFRLKGGGWYETDFKSDQEGKRNLAAGEEADSKPEAPQDSKDAAAPDAKDSKPAETKPAAEAKADKPAAKRRPAPKPAKKPVAKPKPRSRAKAPARKK